MYIEFKEDSIFDRNTENLPVYRNLILYRRILKKLVKFMYNHNDRWLDKHTVQSIRLRSLPTYIIRMCSFYLYFFIFQLRSCTLFIFQKLKDNILLYANIITHKIFYTN